MRVLVCVTGASGMPLAQCLLELLADKVELGCIVSKGAEAVWRHECAGDITKLTALAKQSWQADDLAAGPASGSWWQRPCAVVVAPCSIGTLGAIAAGLGSNLIQRVAQVALKERIPLALVVRESPLSAIALRNMLELSRAGAIIMPFSPGFYLQPQTIREMLEQFCYRILDQCGIDHEPLFWEPQTCAPLRV